MAVQSKMISWQAPEFRYYHKNQGWYVTVVAVTILIVGFFIVQDDWFAAISLAIIAGIMVFLARQTPEQTEIHLTHKHIQVGDLIFPYKQIKYFWVVHNQTHKILNFETTAYLNNLISLELEDQDPDEIRSFLLPYLPEHNQSQETFTQRIIHKLKI